MEIRSDGNAFLLFGEITKRIGVFTKWRDYFPRPNFFIWYLKES